MPLTLIEEIPKRYPEHAIILVAFPLLRILKEHHKKTKPYVISKIYEVVHELLARKRRALLSGTDDEKISQAISQLCWEILDSTCVIFSEINDDNTDSGDKEASNKSKMDILLTTKRLKAILTTCQLSVTILYKMKEEGGNTNDTHDLYLPLVTKGTGRKKKTVVMNKDQTTFQLVTMVKQLRDSTSSPNIERMIDDMIHKIGLTQDDDDDENHMEIENESKEKSIQSKKRNSTSNEKSDGKMKAITPKKRKQVEPDPETQPDMLSEEEQEKKISKGNKRQKVTKKNSKK